ncbi:MAG TPA: MBL fold metallo-hydrolase [Acidimicrobiales bacterium]|nr:MBL fold metallo-hydrolase [Acidimicrobiales bacterium]
MRVGDLEVLPVRDGAAVMPAADAFAGTTDEMWAAHRQFLNEDGLLELELGGFLVRAADRVVLVDAGVGRSIPPFEGGRLLDSLAAHGVSPDEVTDVVFTHLHFDHVGWATRQGAIVFPKATYRCDERDWAHFVGPDPGATRKLSPLRGQLETWNGGGPLLPGIDVLAAPGHTPGSTVIVLSSGADRALLLGDVVHCPVQLVDDEWAIMGDVDPELARRTRNQLAAELEGSGTLATGAHFTGMRFGRLLPGRGHRYWSTAGI